MTMTTGATLFSGFEGAGIGMKAAGIKHAWGIELDDSIASVARLNGFNVHTADMLAVDPHTMPPVDILHASPPCPNFSQANAGGKETPLDIALARKVAAFIEVLRPSVFTLENVYKYRKSASWKIIQNTLYERGYWVDVAHVNFADLGVPQTRKRMVVRAMRGRMVPWLPVDGRWIGWYEAVEDIIATLPPSQFAPWQLERLPVDMATTLVDSAGYPDSTGSRVAVHRDVNEPANTIVANHARRPMRAFLASDHSARNGIHIRTGRQPAQTVRAGENGGATPRAFLVDGKLSTSGNQKTLQINQAERPAGTVVASHPAFRDSRAWLGCGRVVSMTPRVLARFQSFPDWYRLPDKAALACRGIGNACPPVGMEAIYRGLLV